MQVNRVYRRLFKLNELLDSYRQELTVLDAQLETFHDEYEDTYTRSLVSDNRFDRQEEQMASRTIKALQSQRDVVIARVEQAEAERAKLLGLLT